MSPDPADHQNKTPKKRELTSVIVDAIDDLREQHRSTDLESVRQYLIDQGWSLEPDDNEGHDFETAYEIVRIVDYAYGDDDSEPEVHTRAEPAAAPKRRTKGKQQQQEEWSNSDRLLRALYATFQALPNASDLELRLNRDNSGSLWTKGSDPQCLSTWNSFREGLEHIIKEHKPQ